MADFDDINLISTAMGTSISQSTVASTVVIPKSLTGSVQPASASGVHSVQNPNHNIDHDLESFAPSAGANKDYVDILQAEYLRRKTKNPLYSVRAFAMHLKIHVSALSRILNRKQALSLKAATVVVKNLDLPPEEQECLLLSIAAQRVNEIVDRLSKPLESRLQISFDHNLRAQ